MTDTAIVISNNFIAPVVDVHSALVRYQAMKDFIEGALRENVDFGKIPGTDKPTLLKPGAEKLSNFFGLAPTFEIVEKELDWSGEHHNGEAFFYFHYRCRMMRGEMIAAEGEGSASSFEKKYRYRLSELVCPMCGKAAIRRSKYPPRNAPNAEPGWYCHDKAGGCGAQFGAEDKRITDQPRGQVKNPDIADVVNTLQKMAQKRAYVAAVLLAVNGSEYFTQDVEDFVIGEFTVLSPEPTTSQPAKTNSSTPPPTTTTGNGNATKHEEAPAGKKDEAPKQAETTSAKQKTPARPYDPETLKRGLTTKADNLKGKAQARPEYIQQIAPTLEAILNGEQPRHELIQWLTGRASLKELTPEWQTTLYQWLKPEYDKVLKTYLYDEMAAREAHDAHLAAIAVTGQAQLPAV